MTITLGFAPCLPLPADDRIDDVMHQDPAFPEETTTIEFQESLKPLWLQALNRPESELQRMAADTIALAHRAGMTGLHDASNRLIEIVDNEDIDDNVRNAAARALVALDAQSSASAFRRAMKNASLELTIIIEPALAQWNDSLASEIWRKRLNDATTERARLLLAIECLGAVEDANAAPSLLKIVADVRVELPIRLAAAKAVEKINTGDILSTAENLATGLQSDQQASCLLATTLLGSQSGRAATLLLKELASNPSSVIAGLALQRLFEIDPSIVSTFAESNKSSTDVNVRRVLCEAMAIQADSAAVIFLGAMLSDTNPRLRQFSSNTLIHFADNKGLREDVITVALKSLSNSIDSPTNGSETQANWRGVEQAIIILGSLDHEPSADRFFELLDYRRPEVAVAAAWGLRKLEITATLPAMFIQAQQRTTKFRQEMESWKKDVYGRQLSQLFQAFGEMKFSEAEPLLVKFIPKKTSDPVDSRAAAIWAIGKIREGNIDESLAKKLARRLADTSLEDPEMSLVRRMSAIALGRMNADSQLRTLRRFATAAPFMPGQACAWSLQKISGEIHEFSLEQVVEANDWFLIPH